MSGFQSHERPDALELLEIARETLLDAVLPALDGDARYQALMVANAIAIAMRELRTGSADAVRELELLAALYGGEDAAPGGGDEQARLQRLNHRLARDLRSGELDGAPQLGVRRLLREQLRARLSVSNPKRVTDTAD